MSSSVRSWRQMVTDADPDFMRESLRPVVYEFPNGRKFRQRNPLYGSTPAPVGDDVLTIDGDIITIDGDTLTLT